MVLKYYIAKYVILGKLENLKYSDKSPKLSCHNIQTLHSENYWTKYLNKTMKNGHYIMQSKNLTSRIETHVKLHQKFIFFILWCGED